MARIADVLDEKGREVYTVGPDDTVFEAIRRMVEHNVGALVVVDEGGIAGIVTERDYLCKVVLKDRSSKSTAVRTIMTSKVVTVSPEESVDHCMGLMLRGRFRHLPVVEGDRLVGVVSAGDLMRAALKEKQGHIDDLEKYIGDTYPR